VTTQQQQRGIKRPHDIGMFDKLNQSVNHQPIINLFLAISNDRVIIGKPSGSVPSATGAQQSSLPAGRIMKKIFFKDLAKSVLDFFDSGSSKSQIDTNQSITKSSLPTTTNTVTPPENSSSLPEGFFDDPQADARIRKVEYVDKMEVEWDAFTREMKQETNVRKLEISIKSLN
jgi:hypothetical protein